jgi:pimeloyl-ACP methyl ester carboxylesterase
MLMGAPLDQRLAESYARQTTAFRSGAALLEHPPEVVAIPYQSTTLPGYFFRVDDDPRPRRTMVLVNGYDGTAEELYFLNAAAALARGYHVLAFDGPGQGAALIQQGLVMRADWDAVMTPVLDFVLARPDVDPDQIVLMGLSLGAHLAPRAASVEHRFAACVADCGAYDMHAAALSRIPGPLAEGLDEPDGRRGRLLQRVLGVLAGRPTAGWGLRRGLLVHGVATPLDYLRALADFSLVGHAERITCPTLVCNAEGDDISASAPALFAALTCPKELITFTAAEGAGDHCEAGARLLFHARVFGWLDTVLSAPR